MKPQNIAELKVTLEMIENNDLFAW